MSARLLVSVVLLAAGGVCASADGRVAVGNQLDRLVAQINDGCSSEVRKARTIYELGTDNDQIYAALFSIEGYHCGNGHTEFLAVYRTGYAGPKHESEVPRQTYWLAALETVGGRGERMVDFDSLKWSEGVFTLNAKAYKSDPQCCPSSPVVLRYKLSFFGLSEMQPNTSLERTRER